VSDLFPIPPTLVLQLKKVTRLTGEQLLAPYKSNLTEEQYTAFLDKCQPDVALPDPNTTPAVYVRDPGKRIFMAAAWLAGASFPQIASLYGVRRQTIQDQVNLVLPAHKRATAHRLVTTPPPFSYELLAAMRHAWEEDRAKYGSDLEKAAQALLRDGYDRAGEIEPED
jgi:hypothetical protein